MAATSALRNMTARQRRDVYRGNLLASCTRDTSHATLSTPADMRYRCDSPADMRYRMPRDFHREEFQGTLSTSDARKKKMNKSLSVPRPKVDSRWRDTQKRLRPGEDEGDTSPQQGDSPGSPFIAGSPVQAIAPGSPFIAGSPVQAIAPGSAQVFAQWPASPAIRSPRRWQVEPGELPGELPPVIAVVPPGASQPPGSSLSLPARPRRPGSAPVTRLSPPSSPSGAESLPGSPNMGNGAPTRAVSPWTEDWKPPSPSSTLAARLGPASGRPGNRGGLGGMGTASGSRSVPSLRLEDRAQDFASPAHPATSVPSPGSQHSSPSMPLLPGQSQWLSPNDEPQATGYHLSGSSPHSPQRPTDSGPRSRLGSPSSPSRSRLGSPTPHVKNGRPLSPTATSCDGDSTTTGGFHSETPLSCFDPHTPAATASEPLLVQHPSGLDAEQERRAIIAQWSRERAKDPQVQTPLLSRNQQNANGAFGPPTPNWPGADSPAGLPSSPAIKSPSRSYAARRALDEEETAATDFAPWPAPAGMKLLLSVGRSPSSPPDLPARRTPDDEIPNESTTLPWPAPSPLDPVAASSSRAIISYSGTPKGSQNLRSKSARDLNSYAARRALEEIGDKSVDERPQHAPDSNAALRSAGSPIASQNLRNKSARELNSYAARRALDEYREEILDWEAPMESYTFIAATSPSIGRRRPGVGDEPHPENTIDAVPARFLRPASNVPASPAQSVRSASSLPPNSYAARRAQDQQRPDHGPFAPQAAMISGGKPSVGKDRLPVTPERNRTASRGSYAQRRALDEGWGDPPPARSAGSLSVSGKQKAEHPTANLARTLSAPSRRNEYGNRGNRTPRKAPSSASFHPTASEGGQRKFEGGDSWRRNPSGAVSSPRAQQRPKNFVGSRFGTDVAARGFTGDGVGVTSPTSPRSPGTPSGRTLLKASRCELDGTPDKIDRGIRTQSDYAGGGPSVLVGPLLDADMERSRFLSTTARGCQIASSPCSRQPSPDTLAKSQVLDKSCALKSQGVSQAMTWSASASFREHQDCHCSICKPFSPTGAEAGQHTLLMQHNRFPRCVQGSSPDGYKDTLAKGRIVSDFLTHDERPGSARDSERGTPRQGTDAAGCYSRHADRGLNYSGLHGIQDDSAGHGVPCLSPDSLRDHENEPRSCQGRAKGFCTQPSDYLQRLASRRQPEMRYHGTERRSESAPPPKSTWNPLTHEGAREDERVSQRRNFPRFDGHSSLAQFVEPPSLNPPSPALHSPVLGMDAIGCRGEPPKRSPRQGDSSPIDLQAKHKRQQSLKGEEVGKLIQNAGYYQALAEMLERKVSDARYAEACRATAATMKEKTLAAAEVKRRTHPTVANVVAHLQWDDR